MQFIIYKTHKDCIWNNTDGLIGKSAVFTKQKSKLYDFNTGTITGCCKGSFFIELALHFCNNFYVQEIDSEGYRI